MGYFIHGLAYVIELILNMMQLLIIASVVISWLNAPTHNQIVQMVQAITEPMYRPIRKLTKNIPGPFDWAPLILIFLIIFLLSSLVPYLNHLAKISS